MVYKNIFSHYIGNFFISLPLLIKNIFTCWSKTFYFISVLCALGVISKESIAKATDKSFYRFLLILLASSLTFRSLIHFELVFLHNSISFFCRWIFRFPNNIYLETNLFSVVQSWTLCQRLADLHGVDLLLSSLIPASLWWFHSVLTTLTLKHALKSCKMMTPLLFLLHTALDIWGGLGWFPMNFRNVSISIKKKQQKSHRNSDRYFNESI